MTLPQEVIQAIHRLRDPATPYDHLEFGGWIIQRIFEEPDRSGGFDVVVSVVVSRVFIQAPAA